MSSDSGQFGRSLDKNDSLFPYPEELTDYHFSMNKTLNARERADTAHLLQVEFYLLSPVEFIVVTSSHNHYFVDLVLKFNERVKYRKDYKHPNRYELNLKHYSYILSRVQYVHGEECYFKINYNHFEKKFITALISNVKQNDNILTFIQNPKSQMSIIESLVFDPKYEKSMKTMIEFNLFEDFKQNQLIAFYMTVVRNGRAILADKEGKSLTALAIMTYYRDEWPLVIVCDRKRRKYWFEDVFDRFKCTELFRITVVDNVKEIYVWPKPFHDIIIMDYELYYEVKDTISFRCLNIKAYIFEDQSRGHPSHSKQWKGLSKAISNLQKANRILFISAKPYDHNKCIRFWPLLEILDQKTFNESTYPHFEGRYCEPHPKEEIWVQIIKEFQILLRSTFLICDQPID